MEWPSFEERKRIYELQAQVAQIVLSNNRLIGLSVKDAKWVCEQFGFQGIDVEVPEGSQFDLIGSSCHVPHIMLATRNGSVIGATHNG
jgi:hypothetical protein